MPHADTSNKELVRLIFEEGWNRQSFGYLEGRMAPMIPFHYNGHTMTVPGDSLPSFVSRWRAAFPDLRMTVRHLVAEDDLFAISLTMTGTHEGEWHGREASGAQIAVEETMFFRFEGDVLVEMWELFDEHGLHAQLDGER